MRGHAARGGEDAARGAHARDVVGRGLRADQDHPLRGATPRRLVGGEDDRARRGAGRGRESRGEERVFLSLGRIQHRVEDLIQVLGLLAGLLGDALHVTLGLAAGRRQLRALRPLGLHVAKAILQLRQPLGDGLVALGLDLVLLGVEIPFDVG